MTLGEYLTKAVLWKSGSHACHAFLYIIEHCIVGELILLLILLLHFCVTFTYPFVHLNCKIGTVIFMEAV